MTPQLEKSRSANRKKTYKKMNQNRSSFWDREDGFTMPEAIVTILVIGIITSTCIGLSSQILKQMDDALFNSECENILSAIYQSRDGALMSGHQRWIMLTQDSLYYQDPVGDDYTTSKRLALSHSTIKSDMPEADFTGKKIYFSVMGTVETGATFKLFSRSGRYRYLVIQPVTGRIYLTP